MKTLNKIKTSIKNFAEKLTKKQILVLGGAIPLGIVFGMTLRISLTKISGEFEKYNSANFSILDTLKIDTALVKRGELYVDTLVDYCRILKEDIKFETFHYNIKPTGSLSLHSKEISKYKLIEGGILSEEIFGKNNETKTYYLVGNFFGEDFKLNKLELMKYGTTSNFLDDSFNAKVNNKKDTSYEIYTRETDLGRKVLDSEQAEVKKYLEKILEHKKSLKD